MSGGRLPLLLLAAGCALVWVASPELRWPARALTTFLVLPLPFLLVLQARLISGDEPLARLPVYLSSALSLWALAGITALVARTSGFTALALGLAPPASWTLQLSWAGGLTAAGIGVVLAAHRLGLRESGILAQLLPRTRSERAAFVGLSITAGCCEELVFRAFLITALYTASGSLVLALMVSSLVFGITHAYQQPGGVARATLLGLILAMPYVLTGSLLAPVLAHTAIDLIGGLFLGERLAR